jgi:predicted transcriptional regulator
MATPLKDKFMALANSLKKHQRAELIDEKGQNLIEHLYTDPYEGNFVLTSMLDNQTTLLIGRKGTGKSTIIGRFQHEVRKDKTKLSLYLNVWNIYDLSTQSLPANINASNVLSVEDQRKHELYKHFLKKILEEIYKEINKDLFAKNRVSQYIFGGTTEKQFKEDLSKVEKKILTPKYDDFTALIQTKRNESYQVKEESKDEGTSNVELSPKITKSEFSLGGAKLSYTSGKNSSNSFSNSDEYTKSLIRYFNIVDLIKDIRELLESIGVNRVYICLDDASELKDKEALDIFMRTIVAPLHNNSETFFRFKIAFYPNRDYLPGIDRTKIDTIHLDYYDLYKSSGVDKVETEAISYTKRLLETRFKYFFGNDVDMSAFFDTRSLTMQDYYRIIFQMSANVPRNIGKLLWYVSRRSILNGFKITKRALQDAVEEQYKDDIEKVLTKSEFFVYKSYDEKYEREHLKRLLEMIIDKAKENRRHIAGSNSKIFKNYTFSDAPSNYLFVPLNFENFLASLELNFFISKFTQQKDKGSFLKGKYIPPRDVFVYTLNYGLCRKENILVDEGSDRKFRTERIFDYTELISMWANSAQIVRCSFCNSTHDIKEWETIESFGRFCKTCQSVNACYVETVKPELSDDDEVAQNIQVSERLFDILNTLRVENQGLNYLEIAEEVDASQFSVRQYVRRDRFLMENGFIEKRKQGNENKYFITEKALQTYFKEDVKPETDN